MGKLKALLLAGAASALSGAAFAADLPPPPPPSEPAPYVAPVAAAAEFSGWYLRGDVGIGFNDRPKLKTTPDPLLSPAPAGVTLTSSSYGFNNQDLSASGAVDFGVGYQFNNWLRFDVTGEYRGVGGHLTAIDQFNTAGTFAGPVGGFTGAGPFPYTGSLRNFYSGHISSIVAMANGYVDLGSWYGITPYIGAGAGVSRNTLSGLNDNGFNYITLADAGAGAGAGTQTNGFPTGGFWKNRSNTQFAWALMAGLGYNVTNNLKLELGYRYINLGRFKSGQQQCFNANGSIGGAGCIFTTQTQRLGSHDIRLGMRWMLNEAPAAPAQFTAVEQPPIVRKF
jgi:opacity protein-like surface antigen